MVQAQAWILRKHFDGFPKDSDFELRLEQLPEPQDGEVLLEAVFLSVDPYMRLFSRLRMQEGDVMIGTQVARVVQGSHAQFPVGCHVVSRCGWRTHSLSDGSDLVRVLSGWPEDVPLSLALGAAGMPGLTALYGLEDVLQVKAGETLLVSAAAGAVGTTAGQIAMVMGCRVVGSAGSDAKVAFLRELGFHQAFNYKAAAAALPDALRAAAPAGYDCYFDNVGGEFHSVVLEQMKPLGRVAVCGAVSTYNDSAPQTGRYPHLTLIMKQLKVEGFLVGRWQHKDEESIRRLIAWISEGRLKCPEHVTLGFRNMPAAFMGMLRGDNVGKAIVKV